MKSKAALTLMEQMIMALVLVAAAAVSLRVFVYTDALSKKNTAADAACIQAQSAAETLKSCGGDMNAAAAVLGGTSEGDRWVIGFDGDWRQTEAEPEYTLTAEKVDGGTEYLGKAKISVLGGEELFSIEVCWQEG